MGDAGLPAGSELIYNASWDLLKAKLLDPLLNSAKVTNDAAAQLGAQGIIVQQQQSSNTFTTGVTRLQVKTISDRNASSDVKAVIDGVIYGLIAQMPVSSISTITQTLPSTPAGTPVGTNNTAIATDQANIQAAIASGDTEGAAAWQKQYQIDAGLAPSTDLVSWLSNNWMWVAGFGVGALVLRQVL
jgi:hypothetical protein